jgi:hypothetical protein
LSSLSANDFGVKVGVNHSTRGGRVGAFSPKYVSNFNFGFLSVLPIANKVDLQIEFLYDTYGYKIKIPVYHSTGTYLGKEDFTLEYKYLNLPIILSVRFFEYEQSKGKVYLGSNLAYLLDAKSNLEFERDPNFPEENANKIAYGFLIGTNFFLNIAENQFVIDLRYYFSLNAIDKNEDWDRGYHKSISLSVGYLF